MAQLIGNERVDDIPLLGVSTQSQWLMLSLPHQGGMESHHHEN